MKYFISILLIVSASVSYADCDAVRTTVEGSIESMKNNLLALESVANDVNLVQQRKSEICWEAGQYKANAEATSALVVASLGPYFSLKCYKGDEEERGNIIDSVYFVFNDAQSFSQECSERRTKNELLLKINNSLLMLKALKTRLSIEDEPADEPVDEPEEESGK